jgi:hypothetical protein
MSEQYRMDEEIDYHGMRPAWFPMARHVRKVLESIDTKEPTSRTGTSAALYALKDRGWVEYVGYDPNAGARGKQLYLRTERGTTALSIDSAVQHRLALLTATVEND